jgi:hypothetical protein
MGGRVLLLMIAALVAGRASAVPACHAASEPAPRPLVELFTSEGCDSCPPADRWLSSTFPADRPSRAIALAFHVDYWDRLGWVDRFASAAYTERQYDAMRANRATFVYTPQVLLQGHEYAWRSGQAAIETAAHKAPAASITLDADPGATEVVVHAQAGLADRALARDARLFVAYTDSGLVSEVKAGENRGVRLAHDHVVRALRVAGSFDATGRLRATWSLPRPREAGSHPTLVAFVQRASNGDVLQALPLALDDCAAESPTTRNP